MTPARTRHVPSLRSMTGFGRAEVSAGPIAITVEARSLNHRHLDVTFRLPRALAGLEMDARRVVQARLERGHVTLAWVLERPGVVRLEEADAPTPDTAWPVLSDALSRALDELVAQRGAEGQTLATELQGLTAELRAQVDLVEARVPSAVTRREERLRERIRALLGEASIGER